MGMAASQARLLSITARLSNNENSGQSISYSKQRLADQTQQITNEYNEALNATKLTVLTGFNGAEANYEDISYNTMTSLQMAENTKQYVVTDTKGKVLVTEAIADAYANCKGNYNQFLANIKGDGDKAYSQADITVQKTYTNTDAYDKDENPNGRTKEQQQTEQKIHEAWDKYFATVGINLGDPPHDFGFSWTETYATNADGQYIDEKGNIITADQLPQKGVSNIGDGYAGYAVTETNTDGSVKYEQAVDEDGNPIFEKKNDDGTYDTTSAPVYDKSRPVYKKDAEGNILYNPINYEGNSAESRELYEYAMSLTEAYLRVNNGTQQGQYKTTYELDNFKSAADADNTSALKYYKNIFTKMQSCGYFTYTDTLAKAQNNDNYKYSEETKGTSKVAKNPLKDNYTFEAALRDGSLKLEYYSTTGKQFVSTSISDDNSIQEVPDERAIAKAETKYTQDMADLENKDKKLDLELKKLDTEHNALQTEYDSVKSVVDKNVESTFKIFS